LWETSWVSSAVNGKLVRGNAQKPHGYESKSATLFHVKE